MVSIMFVCVYLGYSEVQAVSGRVEREDGHTHGSHSLCPGQSGVGK